MKNRQWILSTIAIIIVVGMVVIASMIITDDYALFRRPESRDLPIYYSDRMGKSLLNIRYVPSNFDALLIGPSSSVNWEPQIISQSTGFHLYNESLEGGNAAEEKLLVDQALIKGHFKLAIVLLYPTMISSHDYHDGMDKVRWTEALGSLDACVQTVLSELTIHHLMVTRKQHATPDGSHEMLLPKGKVFTDKHLDFTEDPAGMRDMQALVQTLQSHNVRVVYVVPTVYESVLQAKQAGFSRFLDSVRSRLPEAPVIDLDAPEYTDIRSNPGNYVDAFHMTPDGARQLSQIINGRLRAILSQNQVR